MRNNRTKLIRQKITFVIQGIVIVVLLPNLMACFGVSQSEFNTIYEEISEVRSEKQQLSYDLAVLQNKFDQHKEKLTEYSRIAEVDFPALRSKVEETHLLIGYSGNPGADLAALRSRADEARVLTEVLIIILEIVNGDFSHTFLLLDKIRDIKDEALRSDLKDKIENIYAITPDQASSMLSRILTKIETLLQ